MQKGARATTVADLQKALAGADGEDEVLIYADAEGEVVEIPPYFDKRAAVCGYFAVADVSTAGGMVILTTGAEMAL